jgi:hypothetical protein
LITLVVLSTQLRRSAFEINTGSREEADKMQSVSRKNMPLYLGLAAAGAGGYYLYRAGGDSKQATNQAKRKFRFSATSFVYSLV